MLVKFSECCYPVWYAQILLAIYLGRSVVQKINEKVLMETSSFIIYEIRTCKDVPNRVVLKTHCFNSRSGSYGFYYLLINVPNRKFMNNVRAQTFLIFKRKNPSWNCLHS